MLLIWEEISRIGAILQWSDSKVSLSRLRDLTNFLVFIFLIFLDSFLLATVTVGEGAQIETFFLISPLFIFLLLTGDLTTLFRKIDFDAKLLSEGLHDTLSTNPLSILSFESDFSSSFGDYCLLYQNLQSIWVRYHIYLKIIQEVAGLF